MTTHETVAAQLARSARAEIDDGKPLARGNRLRQGDLFLCRTDPAPASMRQAKATAPGGVLLAAGEHGEHRLVADGYVEVDAEHFSLASIGLLVHTDQRDGERHCTVVLEPGTWRHGRQRELQAGEIVEVLD